MDGLKALAEAGAMLPVTRDGVRFILGTFDRPLHWIDCSVSFPMSFVSPIVHHLLRRPEGCEFGLEAGGVAD